MTVNEYSPAEALLVILDRVRQKVPDLAIRIQDAIDKGTVEKTTDNSSARRPRHFWKSRRFTDLEALQVAVDALQACFVELPTCIDSTIVEFKESKLEIHRAIGRQGEQLARDFEGIKIELLPETAYPSAISDEYFPLSMPDTTQTEEQRQNLIRLRELITF